MRRKQILKIRKQDSRFQLKEDGQWKKSKKKG
jgi:hypothetical protein